MRNRDLKAADWHRWANNAATATATCAGGYLKRCQNCGKVIYLKCDYDGRWRPYESWRDGSVQEGDWILHDCTG